MRTAAICAGTMALLAAAGCGSSDHARIDVRVDATHSRFPMSWHVSVQQSRMRGDTTTGGERAVPAARGTTSTVFELHGRGRYGIGVVVEPGDHSTGTGCAKVFEVDRDGRYVATIRLNPDRTCTVVETSAAAG